jgi:8-oxo-dGTP diphosphatase
LNKTKPKALPRFAGCIVRTDDFRILCQLRDDKPGVAFPGYWTCSPGGHILPGEKPLRAVRRELKEEFEIRVQNLKLLSRFVRHAGRAAGIYHIFTGTLLSPENRLRCHEGQRAAFIPANRVLKLKQHPVSRSAFKRYRRCEASKKEI